MGIRWYLPQLTDGSITGNCERIVYIGCIHHTTPDLEQQLDDLCHSPPEYLFFGGDLTGSASFDNLKYHFYEVVNTGKKLGLADDATRADAAAICAAPTKQQGGIQRTLADEYRDFCVFIASLSIEAGVSNGESDTSNDGIAAGIRRLCSYAAYGSFVATLSEEIRACMAESFSITSKVLLPRITMLQGLGVKVHMIAGNWDNVPHTAKNIGMDTVFDTAAFFRKNGVQFHEAITTVETETTLHVLVPFWDIWAEREPVFPAAGFQRLCNVVPDVRQARSQGKTIIVLAHGQPAWEPHFPGQECRGYNRDVIRNMGVVISSVQPDEFIYPHQHDPIKNRDGIPLEVNTHYLLHWFGITESVGILMESDVVANFPNTCIATHVPLRHFANLSVPHVGDRKPVLLGGTRLPAMVQQN